MKMHGGQFHVSAALIEAWQAHAPEGASQRIFVSGDPYWRTGEGVNERGESFFIYEPLPPVE